MVSTNAFLTFSAFSKPLHKAKTEGPDPEIENPNAPFFNAFSFS